MQIFGKHYDLIYPGRLVSAKVLLIALNLYLTKASIAQPALKTFDLYHQLVTQAEYDYFLMHQTDSALARYNRAFREFDFVFARDAINALQIAYRESKEIDDFLRIAFQAGITRANLREIPALKQYAIDSLDYLISNSEYNIYREAYLQKLNTSCLNEIYRLGIIDQLNKGNTGRYRDFDVQRAFIEMSKKYGLPGEKNCGIEDENLHEELDGNIISFESLKSNMAQEDKKNLRYYRLDQHALIMHIPLVIMLHSNCFFRDHEQLLKDAYLQGFIHPRDIGCLYDNMFLISRQTCGTFNHNGIFQLNKFYAPANSNRSNSNKLRSAWNISSLEVDSAKKELELSGYKFIWDYW